jgi:hypothetical protein
MKTVFLLIASLSTIALCQGPCDEPRYLELRKKPLDAMSQREFEYFMLKEKYCAEETQKNAARACSLVVVIDSAVIDGKEKDMRVFVDDVEMSPVFKRNVVTVSSGIHRVSLFSLTEIDDYEKKINRRIMTNENKNYNYGIGVMEAKLKQMKNTVKAINAPVAGRITIHYRFTCDTGKTGKCTDDGWSLVPELN